MLERCSDISPNVSFADLASYFEEADSNDTGSTTTTLTSIAKAIAFHEYDDDNSADSSSTTDYERDEDAWDPPLENATLGNDEKKQSRALATRSSSMASAAATLYDGSDDDDRVLAVADVTGNVDGAASVVGRGATHAHDDDDADDEDDVRLTWLDVVMASILPHAWMLI